MKPRSAARLLVVDDDPSICELVDMYLSEAGYIVVCATDGDAALRLIERGDIALGIVDLWLPGTTSGLAVARNLSRRGIATLMMSGAMMTLEQLAALEYPFLQKPFRMEQLLRSVDVILGEAESRTRD
jgi:DNA-binding response OmpR family regulator